MRTPDKKQKNINTRSRKCFDRAGIVKESVNKHYNGTCLNAAVYVLDVFYIFQMPDAQIKLNMYYELMKRKMVDFYRKVRPINTHINTTQYPYIQLLSRCTGVETKIQLIHVITFTANTNHVFLYFIQNVGKKDFYKPKNYQSTTASP
ncbi:hypothetical protein ACTFIV_001648 [Dictyostelium citrinum]